MKELRKFIKDQLSVWPLAAANYRSLKSVRTRELTVGGLPCRVQTFFAVSTASRAFLVHLSIVMSNPLFRPFAGPDAM